MGYEYKRGQSVAGLSAGEVGAELERIRSERGDLTSKAVVEESRPDEAVLHDNFEWDDPKAAELYREQQARSIIHSVLVTDESAPDAPKPQAFISVLIDTEPKPQHVYQPAQAVADNPEWRAKHVALLASKLRTQRRELAAFREFSEVVAAIDALDG